MQIIQNQFLCCNNLLSYRTRVKENRLFDLLEHMEKSTEILGMEIAGNIIFTIKETVNSEKGKILDVEVLMPVSSEFESNEHFVFKPKLRIENALKTNCVLNYKNIFEVKSELMKYMAEKQMEAVTDFYYVIIDRTHYLVDIYIGINGNIV